MPDIRPGWCFTFTEDTHDKLRELAEIAGHNNMSRHVEDLVLAAYKKQERKEEREARA